MWKGRYRQSAIMHLRCNRKKLNSLHTFYMIFQCASISFFLSFILTKQCVVRKDYLKNSIAKTSKEADGRALLTISARAKVVVCSILVPNATSEAWDIRFTFHRLLVFLIQKKALF